MRRYKNSVHLSSISDKDSNDIDISISKNNDIEIIDILDSLKPAERDLVSKVYIQNISIQDIAKERNVKELTILTKLNKIIKRLKMSINS
jgi:DNA-directed RNA polymerase specialized sigma24 family protein